MKPNDAGSKRETFIRFSTPQKPNLKGSKNTYTLGKEGGNSESNDLFQIKDRKTAKTTKKQIEAKPEQHHIREQATTYALGEEGGGNDTFLF